MKIQKKRNEGKAILLLVIISTIISFYGALNYKILEFLISIFFSYILVILISLFSIWVYFAIRQYKKVKKYRYISILIGMCCNLYFSFLS